jgi:PRTRC genetic system protein C
VYRCFTPACRYPSVKSAPAKLPDPNPEISFEGVRRVLATQYPEIATAAISGPEPVGDPLRGARRPRTGGPVPGSRRRAARHRPYRKVPRAIEEPSSPVQTAGQRHRALRQVKRMALKRAGIQGHRFVVRHREAPQELQSLGARDESGGDTRTRLRARDEPVASHRNPAPPASLHGHAVPSPRPDDSPVSTEACPGLSSRPGSACSEAKATLKQSWCTVPKPLS